MVTAKAISKLILNYLCFKNNAVLSYTVTGQPDIHQPSQIQWVGTRCYEKYFAEQLPANILP